MTKANEHHGDVKDELKDRFSSDLETLKTSFAQLRDDVTTLLEKTVGTGRRGAGMLKNRASTAVVDFKDCSAESVEKLGRRIGEKPLLSAAIAMGIGFVLARLFATKR